MADYTRYPSIDKNSNLPPLVREAFANSPEFTRRMNENAFASSIATRPPKPLVVFTFDDGWLNDWTVVKPILDSKKIKASFCIVAGYVGSSATKRLNWNQVHALSDDGHEILNHSYTHTRLNIEDPAILKKEIEESQAVFVDNGLSPEGFVWPFTTSSLLAQRMARRNFKFALGGEGSTVQPLDHYTIERISLTGATDLAKLKTAVDNAKTSNELLIFLTHATEEEFNSVGQDNLRAVIDYVKSVGVDIVTAGEAFEQVGNLIDTEVFKVDGSGKAYGAVPEASTGPVWGRVKWGGGGTITGLTPPSDFEAGTITYNTISNAGNDGSWPELSSANITTERLNIGAEAYTVQHYRSATNVLYVRRGVNLTTWGTWVRPGSTHTVVDAGSATYLEKPASSYAIGTTMQRVISPNAVSPSGGAGMVVTHRMAARYCTQDFQADNGSGLYHRSVAIDDTWLPWQKVTLTAI